MRHGFRLALAVALSLPIKGFSWGAIGHQTIGTIAESRLTPEAAKQVKAILGSQSLANVSTWADGVRGSKKYRQTSGYHYEKMSDHQHYLEYLQRLPKSDLRRGDVTMAILHAHNILRDGSAPKAELADALKFLVHFVGDLHQPMHAGRAEDKGGNKVSVNWMGRKSNLHQVWDSGMMYTGHADIMSEGRSLVSSGHAYANYLEKNLGQTPIENDMDVEEWLDESVAMFPSAYDSALHNDQEAYQAEHLPVIDLRLFSAGLRLAEMLNDIYAKEPVPKKSAEFLKAIEAIVGKISDLISFAP